ncbi:MAG TPA: PspC domain-containing protein, partial [Geminicoccaceae bacterium]|nr:PspC domain-containing protein [Geminicoccaceae bacterium]
MKAPHPDRQPRHDDVATSWQRLYRDSRRAWLAGVCAGIADYFGVSVGLVRFLTFLSGVFFTMPTLFGYLVAALLLRRKPDHLYASGEEEAFWRAVRLEPSRTARDLTR